MQMSSLRLKSTADLPAGISPRTGSQNGAVMAAGEAAGISGTSDGVAQGGSTQGCNSEVRINEVILPWPPRVLSPNIRTHWAAKAKAAKLYRKNCGWLSKAAGLLVYWDGPIRVVLTFYPPDRRHRDLDNCIASVKNLLDGVADALGINDTRFRIEASLVDEVVEDGAVRVRIAA